MHKTGQNMTIVKSPLKSHHNRSKLNVLGAKESRQDEKQKL